MKRPREITIIQEECIRAFCVPRALFYSKRAQFDAAYARFASMVLCERLLGITTGENGRAHNRDRSVIGWARKSVAEWETVAPMLAHRVKTIEAIAVNRISELPKTNPQKRKDQR